MEKMSLNLDALGKPLGPISREYTWKDVALYALGVGAGFDDLAYCYEKGLKVLPGFSAAAIFDMFFLMGAEANINPVGILHGEQRLVFHQPMPTEGTVTTTGHIRDIFDQGEGKGAFVVGECETWHSDGQKLFDATFVLFSKFDGGFGGLPAPPSQWQVPDRSPDVCVDATPRLDQPLLYRLTGDTFHLHVDSHFAKSAGYDGPIMHGLCTHGFACRALVEALTPGAPERIKRVDCRFVRPLYPGVPIQTLIWKTADRQALWRVINKNTGEIVIDKGVVEFTPRSEGTPVRFDGQVAVITGAGGGLGKAYALELSRRGARVVVNDTGGGRDGTGRGDTKPAEAVVREIRSKGGEAVASFESVSSPEGGQAIIQAALDVYGRVDILINNAGILRDKSFAKLTPDSWEAVVGVHLGGAYNVSRPAFEVMKSRGYGRIVFTGSAAGLYGNFGQSNYAAAKMGVIGLMNTLKLEGEKYGIKVNTVAPLAASRLTEDVMPAEIFQSAAPEYVVPMVLYLCADICEASGAIFTAGLGHFSRAAILTGRGAVLGTGNSPPSAEDVTDAIGQISSLEGGREFHQLADQFLAVLQARADFQQVAGTENPKDDLPMTVSRIFERLPRAFNPEAATGVDDVFQFRIMGDEGGDWTCEVKARSCSVYPGVHENPSCTLLMRDTDLMDMVKGGFGPLEAFSNGKLKVSGNLLKSQLVGVLFDWA
ncbi:MAG: SDR family NAD(P)-dependent oxidoreductase [Desulfobacterales bacterium]|jgi:NAD(P)-dependent dehydrogenase (short-subunit alcohol dehydrogenase family)/acyl dehydratase/putative sterol carrier protein